MSAAKLTRKSRTVGGFLLAVIAVNFAALSHTLASAHTPSLFALSAAILVAWPLAAVALGQKQQKLALGIAVIVTQLLFHTFFVWLSPSSVLDLQATHTAHHVADSAAQVLATAPDTLQTAPMLVAHVFAAVFAFLLVLNAERAYLFLQTQAQQAVAKISLLNFTSRKPLEVFQRRLWQLSWALRADPHLKNIFLRGPPLFAVH